ncbi:MAG: hypothetical protein JRJ75_16670 [Deltaproteobacteria bacterium]|nr:hypothetical protein [Deltaproteobacteria bacterium]
MANTTTATGQVITITGLDANWDLETDLGHSPIVLSSIEFVPSDSGDIVSITAGNGGAVLFKARCSNEYDQKTKVFNPPIQSDIYIGASGVSIADGASAMLIITFA